jgi:DNA repair protein SbcD/Mre11
VKVLFLSDTHLGHDWPLRPRSDRRRRGQDFFDNFDRALAYAIDQRVDLVLHGGDMFYRSKVPPFIVDMVYERWLRFVESGIPVGMIAGNHERSVLPPSLLLSHPKLHVFHSSSTHVFDVGGARVAVTAMPFVGEGARVVANLHATPRPNADVHLAMAHEAFEGSAVEGFVFRNRVDVVPLAHLPDFDAYLSGHIHRRQVLWRDRSDGSRMPIIYAGSTERTSFMEKNEEKGFAILDLLKRRLKFVPLPARPMFDVAGSDNDIFDELERLPHDAIIRVTCDQAQAARLYGELSPDVEIRVRPSLKRVDSRQLTVDS